jgi:5'-nucleotidase
LTTYECFDFKNAADIAFKLAAKLRQITLPDGVLLNVNVPPLPKRQIKGMLVTCQGRSMYKERFVKRADPRGRIYYWLTGRAKWATKPAGSDIKAIEDKYVSVTPLQLDLTAHQALDRIKGIFDIKGKV